MYDRAVGQSFATLDCPKFEMFDNRRELQLFAHYTLKAERLATQERSFWLQKLHANTHIVRSTNKSQKSYLPGVRCIPATAVPGYSRAKMGERRAR